MVFFFAIDTDAESLITCFFVVFYLNFGNKNHEACLNRPRTVSLKAI